MEYYTDSNDEHTLVEIWYDSEFGESATNLKTLDGGETFQMNYPNNYITTDKREAVKIAVKGYKTLELKHTMKQDLETYFREYFHEFPELMI